MKFIYWVIGRTCLIHFSLFANGVDGETQDRGTIGLAFPGGSLTTAVTGAAIMRGFQMQKTTINGKEKPALEAFDYVCGLSGGNVPHMQFAYAQGLTSDELLDADGIVEPKDVTYENLGIISDKSMFKTYTISTFPNIFKALIRVAVFGDLFFPSMMHHQLLEPLGIPDAQPVGMLRSGVQYTPVVETCMVGPEEFELDWIYNVMNIRFSENNIKLPSLLELQSIGGFSSYILNHTIVWEHTKKSGYQIAIPAIITPDKFSIPFPETELLFDSTGEKPAGSIKFIPVYEDPNELQPESEKPFSVQKMLALGANSIQIFGASLPDEGPFGLAKKLMTPPLIQDIRTGDGNIRTMSFTDGGSVDLNGIPALVKLGTKNIIQLVSQPGARATVESFGIAVTAVGAIAYYFGIFFEGHEFSKIDLGNYSYTFSYGSQYQMKVFDPFSNGEDQILKFYDKVTALHEAGGPIVVTLENLKVVENKYWGIKEGGTVDLTIIICLDVPEKFSRELNETVAPPPENKTFTENGFFNNKDMVAVPNLISSGQVTGVPIDIDIDFLNFTHTFTPPGLLEQAVNPRGCKMTSIMISWMIKESWDGLKDINGTTVFGGFKSIFEVTIDNATVSFPKELDTSTNSGPILKNYFMISMALSSVALLIF